jgi:hypothetical protein
MKKIMSVLILLCAILFEACQEKKNQVRHSVSIVIIGDITDYHSLLPTAEPILKLYDFESDKNTEAFFRICPITDKHLNPAVEYHLSEGSVTEKDNEHDDPYYREKNVVSFYELIKKAITDFGAGSHLDSSLEYSECFSTIARELQLMKSKDSERNCLIPFSDLQENSSLFNCYTPANQQLLLEEPNKVVDIFKATHLLPDNLKNVQVIFVYQPATREEDLKFNAMLDIYRKLLEPRGATVTVQANNDKY